MPVIKTLKHEMEYDTVTKRAIFNSRNKTGSYPTQDAFPERLITPLSENEIEEHTLKLANANDIEETTLILNVGEIEDHTMII